MILNLRDGEFFHEGTIYSRFFGKEVPVFIENTTDLSYAEKCVDNFNNMSQGLKDDICSSALEYCLDNIDSREGFPVPVTVNSDPVVITECLVPEKFTVVKPADDSIITWQVECVAEHEPEHAVEIYVRDGKLVYLGCYFGGSPWRDYSEDISNYAVKF